MITLSIIATVGIIVLSIVNYFKDKAHLNMLNKELKAIHLNNPKQN